MKKPVAIQEGFLRVFDNFHGHGFEALGMRFDHMNKEMERLDVEGTVRKILTTDYVREQLEGLN